MKSLKKERSCKLICGYKLKDICIICLKRLELFIDKTKLLTMAVFKYGARNDFSPFHLCTFNGQI